MGLSRQEYWSGLQFPSPGDLPDAVINPTSPALAGGFLTAEPPGKPVHHITVGQKPVTIRTPFHSSVEGDPMNMWSS